MAISTRHFGARKRKYYDYKYRVTKQIWTATKLCTTEMDLNKIFYVWFILSNVHVNGRMDPPTGDLSQYIRQRIRNEYFEMRNKLLKRLDGHIFS